MTKSYTPKVTVYMPNYNYGHFICQAVDSVLTQTLSEFELIIIDDGSTDNSPELINRYTNHPKVVTIFQENKGLNVTNNIALRIARGEYLMRLDPDDWLDENALQVMSGMLDRNLEAGLVFPDYYKVDYEGEVLEIVRRHNFDEVTILDQPAHGACTMFRRQHLLNIEGYDESFQCQDGWDIWIQLIQQHKVLNVNLPLFHYRQHSNNLTRDERRLLDTRASIFSKYARTPGNKFKALSIIPVRGPSMDPSSVALKQLGDRAVIDWTIEASLGSEHIQETIVSSPDEDILNHTQHRFGSKVTLIQRKQELARYNTHIETTIQTAIEQASPNLSSFNTIVVLFIECPFRTSRHIDSAIDVLHLFQADSIVGVRPETDEFYRHRGSGLEPIRRQSVLRLEREDLFREVGRMVVTRREFFETSKKILGGTVGHTVFDQPASLSLSSDWDMEIAQTYATRLIEKYSTTP